MSTDFRAALNDLAATFASSVIEAIRTAPLQAILDLAEGPALSGARAAPASSAHGGGGRLHRRSPEEIARVLARVVALVGSVKEGLRAEEIRQQLGMKAKEMPRILREGLASKALKARGQKRSTTYTAA